MDTKQAENSMDNQRGDGASKHAYLIKAHNQFELLQMLVRLLDHPNHDFFVHIDIKVKDFDPELVVSKVKHSRVYFTQKRYDITWGSSTMVWCDLELFKLAAAHGPYSYYHLMTGVDLPLHPAQSIYDFFEAHRGKEFIHFSADAFCRDPQQKKRIAQYHFLQHKIARTGGVLRVVERLSLLMQRMIGIDRSRAYGKRICVGSNWCSVTQDFVEYMLREEAWIYKNFRWCCLPDESYLQILVEKAQLRNRLYMPDPQDDYHSCMRYIDFGRGPGNGSPYTFTEADFDQLIQSDYMFARKFDIIQHPGICYKLEQYLMHKSSQKEESAI